VRILFVSIEYPPETPDGIGSYVAEIAPALVARGHEVHVLSCLPDQPRSDRVDHGVHVHRRGEVRLRGLNRLGARKTSARIRHTLSCRVEAARLGLTFDVVEAADWMAEGLGLAFRRRAPLVVHLHTPLAVTSRYAGSPNTLDLRVASALERAAVRRADLVTSPSERLLAEVGPRWLAGKAVRVVRLPIAPREVEPGSTPDHAPPVVLCVGRLEPLKAPELLVEAAARLQGEVVFVGRSAALRDGKPYGEWLASLAAELGAPVRFEGEVPRDELARFYLGARVVAVPSRHENLPYAGLEALAFGRPVVCRSSSGLAELLLQSGAGTVVREEGAEAFAAALRPFLEDPAQAAEAGARARELVERHCAPGVIAARREAVYLEAISSRRRRRSPSGTGA
jgi:glycosyltransferase involved in cell wall biosynthesis